jgi:enoyl-CoA hydratase/carnithine racemase
MEKRLLALHHQFNKPRIATSVNKGVAVIQMLPDKQYVTLSNIISEEINQALLDFEKDPNVRVVIIIGQKEGFAVGADITELAKSTIDVYHFYVAGESNRMTHRFRKPLIAAVSGMCFGLGVEIALMSDILICTQDVKIGMPEINLGIFPGSGGTQRLTQAIGKSKAM